MFDLHRLKFRPNCNITHDISDIDSEFSPTIVYPFKQLLNFFEKCTEYRPEAETSFAGNKEEFYLRLEESLWKVRVLAAELLNDLPQCTVA